MPLGYHFRLALVYLTFLAFIEGQHFAATPPRDRSMKHINEDRTEEINVDTPNDYPSGQHRSVPITNVFEKSVAKPWSANINADSIWTEKPLSRQFASNLYSTSPSKQHVFRFVNPYPVSGGTTSLRSTNWMNFERFNSNYTPQRFGPDDYVHREGPNYLNQDQYKRHVTGMNPLLDNQTNGNQHGGRIVSISEGAIQKNERDSTIKGIWQNFTPSENVLLSKLKPVLINPAGHSRVLDVSRKSFPQPRFQLPQRPLFQEPWGSYADVVSNIQATNGAHLVSSKSNQGVQGSSGRGTTQKIAQTTNYKPATFMRFMAGDESEVLHPFMNTKTSIHNPESNGQDRFEEIRRTSQSGPFATRLSTSSSATSRGVFSYQRFPSTGSTVVQSQKTLELSQNTPNRVSPASQTEGRIISTTLASQPALGYLDTSKREGDEAKFFGSSPVRLNSSNYSSQPNVGKRGVQENTQRTKTVKWLVVKPYPASNSAREAVHDRLHLSPNMQSISESFQSKQNRPDLKGSTDFHADYKLSSQYQAPQTSQLRSNTQIIPSIAPDVTQHVTRRTGSIHGVLSSKVKPFQVTPISSSQRFLTFANQTSKSAHFKDMKPQARPEVWPATVPSLEGPSAKQLYPQANPSQYKLKVLANLDMKGFKDLGQRNRSIFFRPKMVHDLPVQERSETSTKEPATFSGLQSAQSERSHGWPTNLVSTQNTTVPSIDGLAPRANEADQSIEIYLSVNSSQTSKLNATDAGKTSRQGAASSDDNKYVFNEPLSVFSDGNSSSTEDASNGINSLHEATRPNETLSFSFRPKTSSEDKNVSVSESVPATLQSITPQHEIRHIQAKIINTPPVQMEAFSSSQSQVKSAKEHQLGNEEQANVVQQSSSHINATQSSRPTSRVAVGKRIKVYPKDKSTESQNPSENAQPPIYRSAIIRRKSKSRLLANVSVDLSKDGNHVMSNQSTPLKAKTESSPAEVEGDPSNSDPIVNQRNTNTSVNSNLVQNREAQQSLNSSKSTLKQMKRMSITFLDVAGSASISIHKAAHAGRMLNGTERHSISYNLSNSTMVPSTTELISAAAAIEDDAQPTNTSVNEAIHSVEWYEVEPTPTDLHSLS